MKNSLPRSTVAMLWIASSALAQPMAVAGPDTRAAVVRPGAMPDPADPLTTGRSAPLTTGDRLLVQATNQLERRRSITARMGHRVSFAGHHLSGRGSYWQQGSGEDLRVRLELQVTGEDASLLQVSNSRFLWSDRRLPTGRTVSRIDLRQLRTDPVLAKAGFDVIRPGEASWSTAQPELTAHYGGLPRLLTALSESFSFLPPQAMRLVSPDAPQQASVPFFAVVGHWKPDKLAKLLESQESRAESQEPETKHLPPDRFPQEVLLLFGQADLFPYRIEYRRLETPPLAAANAQPTPYQLSAQPMAVLEFSDVAFDLPIPAGQFDYAPRDADWVDQTAAVLERMRRERQEKVARRAEPQSK
jgi:hypothetical protein